MLADGVVAEEGRHAELVARHGRYWTMFEAQLSDRDAAVDRGSAGTTDD